MQSQSETMSTAAGSSRIFDEAYGEPSEADISEYAQSLGLHSPEEDHALWSIAREALKAPLPGEWRPCKTESGEVYYFEFATGETTWDHPCDQRCRRLLREKLRNTKPQTPTTPQASRLFSRRTLVPSPPPRPLAPPSGLEPESDDESVGGAGGGGIGPSRHADEDVECVIELPRPPPPRDSPGHQPSPARDGMPTSPQPPTTPGVPTTPDGTRADRDNNQTSRLADDQPKDGRSWDTAFTDSAGFTKSHPGRVLGKGGRGRTRTPPAAAAAVPQSPAAAVPQPPAAAVPQSPAAAVPQSPAAAVPQSAAAAVPQSLLPPPAPQSPAAAVPVPLAPASMVPAPTVRPSANDSPLSGGEYPDTLEAAHAKVASLQEQNVELRLHAAELAARLDESAAEGMVWRERALAAEAAVSGASAAFVEKEVEWLREKSLLLDELQHALLRHPGTFHEPADGE